MVISRKRLDGARKKYAAVQRKLESEMGQLDALELRDSELKALHAAEERHLREAQKVTADLKAQQYRQGQALFAERKKERDLISEIAGAHAENRNMKAKITQLEAQVCISENKDASCCNDTSKPRNTPDLCNKAFSALNDNRCVSVPVAPLLKPMLLQRCYIGIFALLICRASLRIDTVLM